MRNLVNYCIIFICMVAIAYILLPKSFNFTKKFKSLNYNLMKPSILLSYFNNGTNEFKKFDSTFAPIKQYSQNPNKNCGFLTVSLMGGLGNLMGEIATLIGLSLATNRKAVVPEGTKDLFRFFPNLPQYLILNSSLVVNGSWKPIVAKTGECCHFDFSVVERITNCETNYVLNGYFMAWQYFDKYSEKIKHAFTINSTITDKAKNRINEALKIKFNISRTNSIVIGIHNRRGDFVHPNHQKFGRMPGSDEYFRTSMIFYRRKHYFEEKKVIFFHRQQRF